MNVSGLATRLVEARRTGHLVGALAADFEPRCDADAYAVQDEVMRMLGAGLLAWKVGSANPTSEIIAAPLLTQLVKPSPARLPATEKSMRGVEAELAVSFARDLPARGEPYGEDEAWAAVGFVHVAIELLDSRYADRRAMSPLALLADHQNNAGFSVGPANPIGATDFLTAKSSLLIDGKEAKSAVGGNPAGHPKRLVAWLANHAASRGRPLRKGDIATTGSHTGLVIAPVGSTIIARFEGLGEASMILGDA